MRTCYDCQQPLTPENSSDEHVLQNSVGGKLKSPLLHRSCNSKMGADADAALASCMNIFGNMLDIKRDRGSPQPIQGTIVETGERIFVDPGGRARLRDTKVDIRKLDGKISFNIQAPNQKDARWHLNRLKRKYPKLDVETALRSMKFEARESGEQLRGQIDFGDFRVFRAVAKAALNFYLHSGGQREQVETLIPYIKTGAGALPIGYFYPEQPVFEEAKRDVLHRMFLVGDPNEQILYCVVSYFDTMSYVVLLNDSYNGPSLAFHHTLNPVLGRSEPRKVLRFLSRAEVVAAIKPTFNEGFDLSRKRIERFLRVAWEKQAATKEFERILEEALASSPPQEGELLSDYGMRVFRAMEPGLMPMISAASERRHAEAEEEFRKVHGMPAWKGYKGGDG